jgi:hypothetical protein
MPFDYIETSESLGNHDPVVLITNDNGEVLYRVEVIPGDEASANFDLSRWLDLNG